MRIDCALLVLAALAAVLDASAVHAQQPADLSPHEVRFVEVEPGVRLEVLDWGGSGDPILFCAGLTDTAHTFDDFAPKLTDSFRVLAITRRGFGASSRPTTGYDSATRARDILAVLDSLGLGRITLAGHSIAGEEITRFAVTYPERVRALIYLDAYSRDSLPGLSVEPRSPPQAAAPPMTAQDSASFQSVMAYLARRFRFTPTAGTVLALSRFKPDGRLDMLFAPNASREVSEGTGGTDYEHVRAPALGVFATHPKIVQWFPGIGSFDAANRQLADGYYSWYRRWELAQIERFRRGLHDNTVLELPGANHYVFSSDSHEVERAVRALLAKNR